ncbi:hypothetical protein DPMN_107455 [Dreissena polymorpha]|uniref:Uncharacterized protein n=1 Tax=Dreissena polymorpha TaxID=45954 RepID=A0A9D4QJY8_DREPO|nr:hypothetical protein DPMN_107455 [Dreissena polymorpha]
MYSFNCCKRERCFYFYFVLRPFVCHAIFSSDTCPTIKPTVTPAPQRAQTTTPRVLTAGSYIAIAIAIVVLIGAIAIVLIVYYIKVKRQKQVEPHTIMVEEKDKAKDVELDGRVSPYFPFPTVSELALYRFGPSEIDDDDGGMTLDATTPGFTDGRRTMYGKDAERESLASLPVYSEVGGDTPEPTRLNEVLTRMSEVSEANIADPTPFTMTRATMNIPEETGVSPLQTPSEEPKANGHASPIDVTL